jgi:hypothetical protein
MVLGQALAVFQAFSLAKLQNSRLLSQKLKFWESLKLFEFDVLRLPRGAGCFSLAGSF